MSPSGDILRSRCRNYPGIVNSTTIDWMFPWPYQALHAVANVILCEVRYFSFFCFFFFWFHIYSELIFYSINVIKIII